MDFLYSKTSDGNEWTDIPKKDRVKLKAILGTFRVSINHGKDKKGKVIYKTITANIGDIPISMNYFMYWYAKEIIAKGRTQMKFREFVRTLSKQFLENVVNDFCSHVFESKISIETTTLNAIGPEPKKGIYIDPIRYHLKRDQPSNALGRLVIGNIYKNYSRLLAQGKPASHYFIPFKNSMDVESDRYYYYFTIYAQPKIGNIKVPESDDKNTFLQKDLERGIYHLQIGNSVGLVKNIKFSKTDAPYLREARFMRQGDFGFAQLSNVYNTEIKMYGNNLFVPGQTVFVNPFGLGMNTRKNSHTGIKDVYGTKYEALGFGLPWEAKSLSRILGIGGYHTIIRVVNNISRGKYETSLTAMWYDSGHKTDKIIPGARRTRTNSNGSTNHERKLSCEVVEAEFLQKVNDLGGEPVTNDVGQETVSESDITDYNSAEEAAIEQIDLDVQRILDRPDESETGGGTFQ